MFFLPIGQHIELSAYTAYPWRTLHLPTGAGAAAIQLWCAALELELPSPGCSPRAGAGTALPAAGHCTGPGTPLPLTTRCPRTSFTLTGENIAQRTCTRLLWVPSISVSSILRQ